MFYNVPVKHLQKTVERNNVRMCMFYFFKLMYVCEWNVIVILSCTVETNVLLIYCHKLSVFIVTQ